MCGVDGHDRWVWRRLVAAVGCVVVIVGVGVGVVGDLLAGAHGAGVFTAVNAGVVEVRVEGAEVAAAAVPQSSHLEGGRWWFTGGIAEEM